MLQKPTVGRALHYWPALNRPYALIDDRQPYHATIVFVHMDGTVNLAVQDHNGYYFAEIHVEILPEPYRRDCATWPKVPQMAQPVQQAQAQDKRPNLLDQARQVTMPMILAEISAQHLFTAGQALRALGHPVPDGADKVTLCLLAMRNGTKIVGVNYGAIDDAGHDPDVGCDSAREAALEQCWALLGYELRTSLAGR